MDEDAVAAFRGTRPCGPMGGVVGVFLSVIFISKRTVEITSPVGEDRMPRICATAVILPLGHHPTPHNVPNVCYRPNNIMVEDPPSSSSNPYPPIPLDVVQILGTRRGAARTDDDLRRLLDALGPVLGGADDVWAALSPRQQTELCRHVEMRTVRDNDGDKVDEYYLGGGEIVTGEGGFGACDLFVLVRGRATVNPPGGRSPFVVRVGGSSGPEIAVFASSRMGGRGAREFLERAGGNRDDGPSSAATPTQVHRLPTRGNDDRDD